MHGCRQWLWQKGKGGEAGSGGDDVPSGLYMTKSPLLTNVVLMCVPFVRGGTPRWHDHIGVGVECRDGTVFSPFLYYQDVYSLRRPQPNATMVVR